MEFYQTHPEQENSFQVEVERRELRFQQDAKRT